MPIKYIPYIPNTVEGQAVLDNFSRTRRVLRYRDNDKVYDRIKRGMPYYEVETVEIIKNEKLKIKNEKDTENNSSSSILNSSLVLRGECISACAYLKEQNIKVDLVYIDPPFASGADYAKKVYIRRNPKLAEKIKNEELRMKNEEQQVDFEELQAFEEKMYGDIWKKEDYLNWMYENLQAIKSIMSDTASIYVHLDWHIGHYVKILMDEVFGEDKFRNEIIYGYRIQGINKRTFPRKHDTLFFYSLSDDHIFNPKKEIVKYEKPFIDTKKTDANLSKLTEKDISIIQNCIDNKKSFPDKYKNILFDKHFAEVYVRDVWDHDETKPIISGANEYLGYATQKSEKLLERIIKASSNEGMIIADFFGGSGVTAKVANDLGRKFIHTDIGVNSIQTVRDRLISAGAEFQIMEIKDGVNLFRNPVQTMDKLAKLIPGLQQKVEGINKFWFGAIQNSKQGIVPVYVPNLIDSKEKVLDIPLINKIINQELIELNDYYYIENEETKTVKKVIVYYIDIANYKEIKQFIKNNNATLIKVELLDLKNFLHDIVVEDIIEIKNEELKIKNEIKFQTTIVKFTSDRLKQKIDEFNEKGNLQSLKNAKVFNPITISEDGLELIEMISIDCTNQSGVWQSNHEIKIDKLGYITLNGKKTKDFWNAKIESNKKPLRLKIRNISGDETIIEIK